MDGQKLKVDLAKPSDTELVRNLLNLYVYDMSEWFKFDPDDDGFFSYDIPKIDGDNHYIYIAAYGDSPAGLALVDREDGQFDMKEFFVLRRYRGTGTALLFLEDILTRLPGFWQIRVFEDNKPAVPFWSRAVSTLSRDHYAETHVEVDGKPWTHYHFQFPHSNGEANDTGA